MRNTVNLEYSSTTLAWLAVPPRKFHPFLLSKFCLFQSLQWWILELKISQQSIRYIINQWSPSLRKNKERKLLSSFSLNEMEEEFVWWKHSHFPFIQPPILAQTVSNESTLLSTRVFQAPCKRFFFCSSFSFASTHISPIKQLLLRRERSKTFDRRN